MGWRFRRLIRIAPGVRLNLSKGGVSTSIGGKGATLNIGKRGPRATVGLPGMGVSYSTPLRGGGSPAPPGTPAGQSSPAMGCGVLIAIGVGLLALARCAAQETPSSMTAPVALASAAPPIAYVSAQSLNCRTSPAAAASVMTSFARGTALSTGEA